MNIAIRHVIFAVVSTIVNLAFQYISFFIYGGNFSLYFAMFNGTLSGLVVKYILDKKFIFYHKPKSKKDDSKKFILYSLMGIFTTIIFWGFEIVFDKLWDMKHIGAIVGLSIGYIFEKCEILRF